MKKQFLSLLIFSLVSFACAGQDSVTTMVSKNRYVNVDFSVGYMHTDLSNINNFLSSYGYKPVSEDLVTMGFGVSYSINRIVFRAEYTWQLPAVTKEPENVTTTFNGSHMALSVGYLIIQKPGFRLFPYVGVDAFRSQLMVRQKNSVTDIDDLVDNQQRGFHLAYSNAALDIGIQADKMFSLKNRKWDCPQNTRYMTVGIRAGYLIGPGTVKGRFNGDVVEGAPSYSPQGPYLKLVIGFSTKMRDLKWKK